jgi:hypothetical protein
LPYYFPSFQAGDGTKEDLREVNKRQLLHVASRVQSEYSFRRAAEGAISNPSDVEGNNEYVIDHVNSA